VTLQSKGRNQGDTTDRQRLIAEGRELLRKARTAKAALGGASNKDSTFKTRLPTPKAASTVSVESKLPVDDIPALCDEGVVTNGANGVVGTTEDKNTKSEDSGWDFDDFDEM
jgi:hypothetical protein